MLVLSRRRGESIIIGRRPDHIEVKVVRISGGRVRLGVEAPQTLNITREEPKRRETK